ncbi:MAG: type II secretion system F family protein [Lentisphaeria bacterium]|nr:type II secretion system F family protein [Lentisphaeria bacterium]
MNLTFLASLSVAGAVICATIVIVEFFTFTSARYREKFLEETAAEMDEVLLTLPPGKILDLSLALSALSAFIAVLAVGFYTDNFSTVRMVIVAVIAAVAAFPIPRVILKYLRKERMKKFNLQLEDALLSISGSLKAGFSINQALDTVANQNKSPISFEFRLLMHEIRLGVSLDTALEKMNKRLDSPDFELIAMAIITARQTGGELTAILERLAGVIRERVRITGRIQALTAQGRLQAVIIGLMPFALFFAMMYVAPDMMNNFFSSVVGILFLMGVIILDVMGFIVIRKITTIDI